MIQGRHSDDCQIFILVVVGPDWLSHSSIYGSSFWSTLLSAHCWIYSSLPVFVQGLTAACRQCVPPATTNKIWEKELEVEGDGVVRREGEEGGSGYPPAPMVGAQIPSPRHHEVSGLVKLCSVHTTCPRRVLKHNFGPEISVWIAGVICVAILGRN